MKAGMGGGRAPQGGATTAGWPGSQGGRGKSEFLLAGASVLGQEQTYPSSDGCLLHELNFNFRNFILFIVVKLIKLSF